MFIKWRESSGLIKGDDTQRKGNQDVPESWREQVFCQVSCRLPYLVQLWHKKRKRKKKKKGKGEREQEEDWERREAVS